MGLELLQHLMWIVDERESCALPTTVLCPEAEAGDLIFIRFVKFREFLAEFVLGHIGTIWMENIALGAEYVSWELQRNSDGFG